MRSIQKHIVAAVMIAGIGLLVGCEIGSSSEVTDQVDQLISQNQAQADAEAAAAAQQPSSSSSGQTTSRAAPSSSSVSSSSTSSGSSGGFVWKPVSDSNGNLVVLLPSSYAGKVRSCDVVKGGSVVERGNFVGNTNGNRPTFRFGQPGAGYGTNLTVVARMSDGSTRTWSIPNGGQRVS